MKTSTEHVEGLVSEIIELLKRKSEALEKIRGFLNQLEELNQRIAKEVQK